MSDLTDAEMAAEFDRLSTDKGDRLAELMGQGAHPETDDTEIDDGTETGLPSPDAAATAAAPTPETTSAQPAAAAAPAAATTDIWANAPADLRDAHQRALAAADQRYRSDVGRQAAHQRRIQLLEAENAALRTPKPAAAADGTPAASTVDPAKPTSILDTPAAKKAREEYPEAVEPFADAIVALEGRLSDIERDRTLSREERAVQTQQAQEAALVAAHPDWRNACASQDFANWLNSQPKAIRDIAVRNGENIVDAEEAIAMVGNFKAHYALTHPATQTQQPNPAQQTGNGTVPQPTSLQQRREAQLRATGRTPSGTGAAVSDGPVTDEAQATFNHFAAKKANRR